MNETNDDVDMELWKTFLDRTVQKSLVSVDVVIGVAMIMVFIVSVIGNTITCVVIYYNKSMHTATNYYLLNLSLSDLIVTFGIPMELYYYFNKWNAYIFSPLECKIHWLFVVLLWNNSILTMTALAVERYVAIWYPLLLSAKPIWRRMVKIILILWLIAITETLAEVMTIDLITTKNLNTCFMSPTKRARIVNGILALFTFVLPTAVMTTVYVMIIVKINKKRDTKRDKVFNYPRNRSKVNKLIVAITLSFLLCWIPFFSLRTLIFALEFKQLIKLEDHWRMLYNASMVNSWVSVAINPILFSLMSTKFRTSLKILWYEKIRRKSDYLRRPTEPSNRTGISHEIRT